MGNNQFYHGDFDREWNVSFVGRCLRETTTHTMVLIHNVISCYALVCIRFYNCYFRAMSISIHGQIYSRGNVCF